MIEFRPPADADTPAIVALNDAVVDVTSLMDEARFRQLRGVADPCIVAVEDGTVIGFVLAMRAGTAYPNANFEWFSARLNRFVYIDRIVIGAEGRGKGLGARLYRQVAEAALAKGELVMAAEMDLLPPNEASLAFHARGGFVAIGERTYGTGKVVSMQVRCL